MQKGNSGSSPMDLRKCDIFCVCGKGSTIVVIVKEVNVNLYLCQWYSDRTQIGTPEIRVSELSYLIYPTDFCLFCIFLVMTLMRLDIIIGKETWIVFFPLTYTWRYYIVFVYYYINMCLCLYIFVRNYFAYTLGKGKYFRAKNYLPKWNRFILLWRICSSKKVTTYKPRQISVFINGVLEFIWIYIPMLSKK